MDDLMAATTADETPNPDNCLTTSDDETDHPIGVRPPPMRTRTRTRIQRDLAQRHSSPDLLPEPSGREMPQCKRPHDKDDEQKRLQPESPRHFPQRKRNHEKGDEHKSLSDQPDYHQPFYQHQHEAANPLTPYIQPLSMSAFHQLHLQPIDELRRQEDEYSPRFSQHPIQFVSPSHQAPKPPSNSPTAPRARSTPSVPPLIISVIPPAPPSFNQPPSYPIPPTPSSLPSSPRSPMPTNPFSQSPRSPRVSSSLAPSTSITPISIPSAPPSHLPPPSLVPPPTPHSHPAATSPFLPPAQYFSSPFFLNPSSSFPMFPTSLTPPFASPPPLSPSFAPTSILSYPPQPPFQYRPQPLPSTPPNTPTSSLPPPSHPPPSLPLPPHPPPQPPIAPSSSVPVAPSAINTAAENDFLLESQEIGRFSNFAASRTSFEADENPTQFLSSISASSEGWSETQAVPVVYQNLDPKIINKMIISSPLNLEREAKLREMKVNEKLNEIFAFSATYQHPSKNSGNVTDFRNITTIDFESLLNYKTALTLSTTSGSQTTDDTTS